MFLDSLGRVFGGKFSGNVEALSYPPQRKTTLLVPKDYLIEESQRYCYGNVLDMFVDEVKAEGILGHLLRWHMDFEGEATNC